MAQSSASSPSPPPATVTTAAWELVPLQKYHLLRHLTVFSLLAIFATVMYSNVLDAEFQFDDLPNIVHSQSIRMTELTWDNLWRSAAKSLNNSRVLVNTSFALQYWVAQFLPRVEGQAAGPAFVPWQFRLVNIYIHLFAGFSLYLLVLRLLQLPRLRGRFQKPAWGLAVIVTLVWYVSPVQVQAVSYIVQRATSMCALFFFLSMLCYLEARASYGEVWSKTRRRVRIIFFFALSVLFCWAAALSKQNGITVFLVLLAMEWLLIGRDQRARAPILCILLFHASLVGSLFVIWAYGYAPVLQRLDAKAKNTPEVTVGDAMARLYGDLVTRASKNESGVEKLKVTPRQRLITEARVVAMYESLLLYPAPSRLSLDYDFRESTELFGAGEFSQPRQWLPLLLVLGVGLTLILTKARWRVRVFLLLIGGLLFVDAVCAALGINFVGRLSKVWTEPWPVPAIVWHFCVLGIAVLYSYRRPLIAFGIIFFYLGHLVESTIISLELVFEHRLYLPSAGFYLAVVLLVYEAFFPTPPEALDPPPLGWLAIEIL